MQRFLVWAFFALFSLVALGGLAQELDLSDALLPSAAPKPKENEHGGGLISNKPTIKPYVKPKEPVKPTTKPKEETLADFFGPTVRSALLPRTSARPLRPSAPSRKAVPGELDLADALPGADKKNPNDKGFGGGDSRPDIRGGNGGGQFTDDDLLDLSNDGYKPDKGTGARIQFLPKVQRKCRCSKTFTHIVSGTFEDVDAEMSRKTNL